MGTGDRLELVGLPVGAPWPISSTSLTSLSATSRGRRVWLGALWLLLGACLPIQARAEKASLQALVAAQDPVYVTHHGDARLFVVEQAGRILMIRDPQAAPVTVLDLRDRVRARSEQGLLSMAFHPDFASTRFFYVNYTDREGATVVERFRLPEGGEVADARSGVRLLRIDQPFDNHNGGQLQVGPKDGFLYVGMGDGGSGFDPRCAGQNLNSPLGKLLRLDIRSRSDQAPYYGIPEDNPFKERGGMSALIWALGLRNPWRFSFDRETSDLYIGDVGQGEIEEIDLQPAADRGGRNYGWRTMEGSRCLSRPPCPGARACGDAGYVAPIFEYSHAHGCSITGGYVYRGRRLPSLLGAYIYGDYCSGHIWALRRQPNGHYSSELLIEKAGERLKSFGEDAEGELLVVVAGDVLRLTAPAAVQRTSEPSAALMPEGGTLDRAAAGQARAAAASAREHEDDDPPEPPSPLSRVLQAGLAVLILGGMALVLWWVRRA